jgi:hypothetical protein
LIYKLPTVKGKVTAIANRGRLMEMWPVEEIIRGEVRE